MYVCWMCSVAHVCWEHSYIYVRIRMHVSCICTVDVYESMCTFYFIICIVGTSKNVLVVALFFFFRLALGPRADGTAIVCCCQVGLRQMRSRGWH